MKLQDDRRKVSPSKHEKQPGGGFMAWILSRASSLRGHALFSPFPHRSMFCAACIGCQTNKCLPFSGCTCKLSNAFGAAVVKFHLHCVKICILKAYIFRASKNISINCVTTVQGSAECALREPNTQQRNAHPCQNISQGRQGACRKKSIELAKFAFQCNATTLNDRNSFI